MRTQAQVEELCRRQYQELGGDPSELIQIKPLDGGWENALSYEVLRRDGVRTRIWRQDLDDNNMENIKRSLCRFSWVFGFVRHGGLACALDAGATAEHMRREGVMVQEPEDLTRRIEHLEPGEEATQ